VSIEEDAEGDLTVVAEDWPNGVATAVAYPAPERGGGGGALADAAPGDCNAPVIFEPPGDLSGGNLEVWIGASGGDDWGGCEIHASRDGDTYSLVGRVNAAARHGVLTGSVSKHDGVNPDVGNTLAVDLTVSKGTLTSASQADADKWETLSYLDGEVVSYRTATLTAANRYNLAQLRRGLFASENKAHAPGGVFMRLDDAVAAIDLNRWNVGETVYLKFPSFNRFGRGLQDLSDVAAYAYTITGVAYRAWAAPESCAISITGG
jgi:hypothetical protein